MSAATYQPSATTQGVTAEVAERMVRADMTADELADATGLGPKALQNRLDGLAPWNIEELFFVAVALDVEVVDFFAA